jgi:hypothetical protein
MKPFNLEEAKAGKRDGRRVEINSFDNPNNGYPILARVFSDNTDYNDFMFTQERYFFNDNREFGVDLMMVEDETIPSLWTQSCTEENTTINYIIKN